MLSTFEMSLDQGKPVLIENMGEGTDLVNTPTVVTITKSTPKRPEQIWTIQLTGVAQKHWSLKDFCGPETFML